MTKRIHVASGLCRRGDSVLLVHQESSRGRYWSLPGGKVDPQECFAAGLRREFAEETGIDAVTIDGLRYVSEAWSHLTHFLVFVFDVTCPPGDLPRAHRDPGGEVLAAEFVPHERALQVLSSLAAPHAREPLTEHLTGGGSSYYSYRTPAGSDHFADATRLAL